MMSDTETILGVPVVGWDIVVAVMLVIADAPPPVRGNSKKRGERTSIPAASNTPTSRRNAVLTEMTLFSVVLWLCMLASPATIIEGPSVAVPGIESFLITSKGAVEEVQVRNVVVGVPSPACRRTIA